jgi:tetratricopeptide (TPR) repeat protein
MATKPKTKSKTAKKAAARRATGSKSFVLKGKRAAKPAPKSHGRAASRVEARRTPVEPSSQRSTSPEKVRSRQFANAVQAYEAAIKLMHADQFDKAIKCFETLIREHPDEPEIQERAKVLIHACEKKIHDRARTVLRSPEDHYNVGVADLNSRRLESAIQHLEHALKLAPKADHVLYALAAANALHGDRTQALDYLRQSIHHRPENRFMAIRDSDFETLQEDSDFKQLVTPPEK